MLGRSLGRWGVCNFPSGRFHIGGLQQRSMAGSRRRVLLKRSQQAATLGAEKACKKGWVSSRRRNQLRSDRRLTKAISLFLQEQRARLEAQLTPSRRMDRFTKRNELMRLARFAFRALPGDEQNKYLHSSAGSSGVGVSSSGSSSSRAAPLAAIAAGDAPTSYVPVGWCRGCAKPRTECYKPFDWACPLCGNHNWARKQARVPYPTASAP